MTEEYEIKKQMLEKWIAQRDDLTRLIEALQRELGMEITPDTGALVTHGRTPIVSLGPPRIKPGEFFGKSQTDAAAVYLKRVGHAMHVDQILDALKEGGIKFTGGEPKTNLYTVLVRGTRRFVLVSPGTFGLVEFYPDRLKTGKKQPGKKRRRKKIARGNQKGVNASKIQRDEPQKLIPHHQEAMAG